MGWHELARRGVTSSAPRLAIIRDPERTLRQVRRLLASTATASDKVAALAQLATELGLEPSTPLEPLPEVDKDDVHLVCWLAIVPPA